MNNGFSVMALVREKVEGTYGYPSDPSWLVISFLTGLGEENQMCFNVLRNCLATVSFALAGLKMVAKAQFLLNQLARNRMITNNNLEGVVVLIGSRACDR